METQGCFPCTPSTASQLLFVLSLFAVVILISMFNIVLIFVISITAIQKSAVIVDQSYCCVVQQNRAQQALYEGLDLLTLKQLAGTTSHPCTMPMLWRYAACN